MDAMFFGSLFKSSYWRLSFLAETELTFEIIRFIYHQMGAVNILEVIRWDVD